jgi:hypothetical protein
MLRNVLIIDRERAANVGAAQIVSLKIMAMLDFAAMDNMDGTMTIIKNRYTSYTGTVPKDLVHNLMVEQLASKQ